MTPQNGLSRTPLDDFSAGIVLDVAPNLIDSRGSSALDNALLNDDGSIALRGGLTEKIAAPDAHGRYIWDGWFPCGRRTYIRRTSGLSVLSADESSEIEVGGESDFRVRPPALVAGLLFWPGGTICAGSRKESAYSTGAVDLTAGSPLLKGTGTSWVANVDPGMLLQMPNERIYAVKTVNNDTEIELTANYEGTTRTGQSYSLAPVLDAASPYPSANVYATIAERLIWVDGHNKIRFSARTKPHTIDQTDYHELDDGSTVIAVPVLGNDLLACTNRGITAIRNMAYNLTNALGELQQREDKLNEIVAWGPAGIVPYRGALVVPATDGVYLMDSISTPVPLASGIAPRYRRRVGRGYAPGQAAIWRDHLILPIVGGDGEPVDTLISRLDRPISARGTQYFPWTTASAGARSPSFCARPPAQQGEVPSLLAVVDSALCDATRIFEPASFAIADHDDTPPTLEWVTRAFATGSPPSINRVRRVRLIYELEAAYGATPYLTLDYCAGDLRDVARWDEEDWDEFDWESADDPPLDWQPALDFDTGDPKQAGPDDGTGGANFYLAAQGRYIRFRIRSSGLCTKLTIRSIEMFSAVGGRMRRTRARAS